MILNRGHNPTAPLSLAQAVPGGSYYVESVSGPEQQRLRLCELGIVTGAPVSVVTCSREGMLVIKVGGSRMALSPGMTEHVFVQKTTSR